MTRAILKNGIFQPLEPVPTDWPEGTEVAIEKSDSSGLQARADAWMDEVERAAAESDLDDAIILEKAIAEIRRKSRELAHQGKL